MFVCPECGASQPLPGACAHDRTPLAHAGEDTLLGTMIGAYRVARLLGIGGMGRVYKGVHPQIGSRVAIKVLSRECSDRRELVERFFAEARAVNLIRHESIVNVLDLASLPDGRPYIIMEYLDGAPLTAAIASVPQLGPLPLGSVARLAVEVLDALGAAHATGIVHRDLKPDNVFVTPSGRSKVLDFGIAKLLPELGGSFTQTGSLLGTPHYMAPEQASGQPIDHRTDLYAMGVILFECATGVRPFHGDSLFDLLRKHVDVPPPQPSTLRADLPPAFEHVILTALAKAPDHRWQSAQAMAAVLLQAISQLPPEQFAPLSAARSSSSLRVPSGAGSNPPGPWSQPHGGPPPAIGAPAPRFGQLPTQGALYPGAQPRVHSGPPGPATHPAHPTTVSGQAGALPAARPRGGAWIALAILAAGAAITAAVVTRRTPTPVAAGAPPAGSPFSPLSPGAPAQIATASPGAPAPGQWITARRLALPGWDARNVDVDAFLAWATGVARQAVPDAELIRFDAMNVYPDGHADLMLSSNALISVRFLSPSRSKRDPSVPIGAVPSWHCMFQVLAMVQTGPMIVPMDGWSCEDERPQPAPRCSVRGAWQRMIARHAPSGNAVAQLGYWSGGKGEPAMWFGSVGPAFAERFADACR